MTQAIHSAGGVFITTWLAITASIRAPPLLYAASIGTVDSGVARLCVGDVSVF